ncbi:UNVERIFIED_CONTAM: Polycystic kidney disease protein 1-like 2 [Trichonephila clavipes]
MKVHGNMKSYPHTTVPLMTNVSLSGVSDHHGLSYIQWRNCVTRLRRQNIPFVRKPPDPYTEVFLPQNEAAFITKHHKQHICDIPPRSGFASLSTCLGQLNYLRIWHDNSGEGKNASWYLKHVVVKDIITGYKYEFIAERWFAVEEGDGLIDYLIPVAGKEQMTEFSHIFPNASRRSLTDNHLWLSIFTRPARSRFTRLQRLSCCLALLYLSMLTSAMWYETTSEKPSPGAFKFGPLSLSPEQVS